MVHIHIQFGIQAVNSVSLFYSPVSHITYTKSSPSLSQDRDYPYQSVKVGIMALFTASSSPFPRLWLLDHLSVHFSVTEPQYKEQDEAQCELP